MDRNICKTAFPSAKPAKSKGTRCASYIECRSSRPLPGNGRSGPVGYLAAAVVQCHPAKNAPDRRLRGPFDGKSFGNNYKLPSDRCYCETCAAIAAMMWNWRLLLATGEAHFAATLERSLYNNFLSSITLDGTRYFSPTSCTARVALSAAPGPTAPAVHRISCDSSLRFVITLLPKMQEGAIHQYLSAWLQTGQATLHMQTDYPWEGDVRIRVLETQVEPWQLAIRIPEWER